MFKSYMVWLLFREFLLLFDLSTVAIKLTAVATGMLLYRLAERVLLFAGEFAVLVLVVVRPFVIICERIFNFFACERGCCPPTLTFAPEPAFVLATAPLPDLLKSLMSMFIPV